MKDLLAKMALSDPARFYDTFRADAGVSYLRNLWDALGANLPHAAHVPADAVSLETHDGFLVLRLPVPTHRNEPFAIAIQGDPSGVRVFLLEKTEATGSSAAMVVELDAQGRIPCGRTADVSTPGFIAHIRMVATEPL